MLLPKLAVLAIIGLAIRYLVQIVQLRRRRNGAKTLPGPKGLPVIGFGLELAKDPIMVNTFNKLGKEYGPLAMFQILGQNHLVISSEQVAVDLLTKRGEIYSDRGAPTAVVACTGPAATALIDKNDVWRKQRKVLHSTVSTPVNTIYHPLMESESLITLQDLLDTPDKYRTHLGRYAYGIVARSAVGQTVRDVETHWIPRMMEQTNDFILKAFRPDMYLCNLIPPLAKLPDWIVPSNGKLRANLDMLIDLDEKLRASVQADIDAGNPPPSFYQQYLQEHKKTSGLTDDQAGMGFLGLFGAGTRSPQNALLTFIVAMLEDPAMQRRLQKAIDDVVGEDRLPTFEDEAQLPMVRAVLKETVRYRNVVAELAIPHKLNRDDYYEGYFIPAATICHANLSAMALNPDLYPDAHKFNPERWLNPKYPTFREPLSQFPTLQGYSSFGFGRRACPGINFTQRALFISIARIAWAFDIKRSLDPETGKEIPLNIVYEPAANTRPFPFPAEFVPRSQGRVDVIRKAYQQLDA